MSEYLFYKTTYLRSISGRFLIFICPRTWCTYHCRALSTSFFISKFPLRCLFFNLLYLIVVILSRTWFFSIFFIQNTSLFPSEFIFRHFILITQVWLVCPWAWILISNLSNRSIKWHRNFRAIISNFWLNIVISWAWRHGRRVRSSLLFSKRKFWGLI